MINIKNLRVSEKRTAEDVANYLGVTVQAYYKYENEKSEPSINNLIKLADYYNVTLDYLVGRPFSNDVGYLEDSEKELLANYRKMSSINKATYLAQGQGILLTQK